MALNEPITEQLFAQRTQSIERTINLSESVAVQENVVALTYSPEFMDELNGLTLSKRVFDLVVIDCTSVGFFFTAEVLVEAARVSKSILAPQGAMLFVKTDKAVAIVREGVVGSTSFHTFDTLAQVYEYSPSFARQIQIILGSKTDIAEGGSDLSEQILMSSIPVLTPFGIKLKAGMESTRRRNMVLCAIDNYAPLSALVQRLLGKVSREELFEELRFLEESGAIYSLFAKVPFLVHCFKTKTPFKLKDYLIESRMVSLDQLDNLFISIQGKRAASLGTLCVTKNFLSSRQLEIALQDIAFYGQGAESEKVKMHIEQDQDSRVHSLVGHLGNTDAAGLLQSLANNRENGVLSVQSKDMQFRAVFEQGKLTRAKLGKLKANEAVVEFVSVWKDGVFVFMDRQPPADLADESCTVSRPIDKLLLDSALACDNIESLWKKLPKGPQTQLEKVADVHNLFQTGQMVDPQENTQLTPAEIESCKIIWAECDGLAPISATIKKLRVFTTSKAAAAINRLLHHGLVSVSASDIAAPLEKFRAIVQGCSNRIGQERTVAMLRLSLAASQGYSAKGRMFQIGSSGEIGVDLSLARTAGVSLTEAVQQLEDWQVSFIQYVSQEIDKNVLREIVSVVYRQAQQQ